MKITLKQLEMLVAVADHGGYMQAANVVNQSLAAIHSSVKKLQSQLGVELLETRGRNTQLTDSGKVLVRYARDVLQHAEILEELAKNLATESRKRSEAA